ncbi:MAG: hypothetical protein AB8B72_13540 [Crocinitomicaceae bacterium]
MKTLKLITVFSKISHPDPYGGTPESSALNVDPTISNYIILITVIVVGYLVFRVWLSIRNDKK